MIKPPGSPAQFRAVIRRIEEEGSRAFSELVEAIVEEPSRRTFHARTFMVRLFDACAEQYETLVSNEEQFRSYYLPKLERLSAKIVRMTEKWIEGREDLWTEIQRRHLIGTLKTLLTGRTQHWKADVMKRLREAPSVVPVKIDGRPERTGHRTEVQRWMTSHGIEKLSDAAMRLGLSVSALKSIMSSVGKPRYGPDTLERVLGIIRKTGKRRPQSTHGDARLPHL
jgi:hypothetical protein